jgi:hypothetical protein
MPVYVKKWIHDKLFDYELVEYTEEGDLFHNYTAISPISGDIVRFCYPKYRHIKSNAKFKGNTLESSLKEPLPIPSWLANIKDKYDEKQKIYDRKEQELTEKFSLSKLFSMLF